MKDELLLNKVSGRPREITDRYLTELEKHIDDLRFGRAERTLEVQDLAEKLHVHPTHLSNTLHQVLGLSPCDLYESRLLALAKDLLTSTNKTVAQIAHQLYYDPNNFTKSFYNLRASHPKSSEGNCLPSRF